MAPSLAHAKLQEADLRGASLEEVDLRNTELKGARLDLTQAIHFAQCFGIVVG